LSKPSNGPRAAIVGCAGRRLNRDETQFFREADPLGFILFARNIDTPDQVISLVGQLRDTLGRNAPILIDQEGGRVQRLRPPNWRAAPASARFAECASSAPEQARRAAWINARLIAAELAALGIDVDCTPVLDNPVPGAHDIIGDRAYGSDPEQIVLLGRAVIEGLMAGGVLPVIKHVPGHGRAGVDSHTECPVVTASDAELEAADLPPFRALADAPFAMTAHVIYSAWDRDHVATLSPTVIADVIRGRIGFAGALISDDLGMQALDGTMASRAARAQAAGCDILLHCSGDLDEMVEVASATELLSGVSAERVNEALARRAPAEPADLPALAAELDRLLAMRVA
jgi:beta-N-acetylhexosaminidase